MEERKFNYFVETSSKDNKFVKDLFEQIFAQLYEYHKKEEDETKKNITAQEEEEDRRNSF